MQPKEKECLAIYLHASYKVHIIYFIYFVVLCLRCVSVKVRVRQVYKVNNLSKNATGQLTDNT